VEILVAIFLGLFILVLAAFAHGWLARYRARRWRRGLRRLRTRELVDEVRSRVRSERWERFSAGARVLREDATTDERLLEDLHELYVEAVAATPGVSGPDGNVYRFYDSGLASILEALAERTGRKR
jgi:hypothetical protein